jgi:prolyl-tRNA synthetase
MQAQRAIEIGNIFKLGTHYTTAMSANYLDKNGKAQPVVMGCYGIGVGRAAASVVEQSYDDRGIIWPASIAPFHVSLLAIGKDEEVATATDALYETLQAAGIEVLYDDRGERPGVKFNDADLIGNPIRLSISRRTLDNNEVEMKLRTKPEAEFVAIDGIVDHVRGIIERMLAELQPQD